MRAPFVFVSLLASIAITGCEARLAIGATCDLNSDCASPLVCRNDRCRVECREARDCAAGLRCVIDESGASCSLPVEDGCSAANPCPGALVCSASGQCRSECTSDDDCTETGRCDVGSCVEVPSGDDGGVPLPDAGCTPGPLTCGNGLVDSCDGSLSGLATAVTGGAAAELFLLDTFALPATAWPVDGAAELEPEIALGISSIGYGVVGHVGAGEAREVRLYTFPLNDFSLALPAVVDRRDFGPPDPPMANALTLALGEHGTEVHGFVLLTAPPGSGDLSAHRLIFGPGGGGTEVPLSAGPIPSIEAGGHGAILGGTSSVVGSDLPLYYLAREIATEAVAGTVPAFGAVDEDISMDTYASIATTPFTSAPFVETSASAGSVMIVRDGAETIGIWNVARTPSLSSLGGVRREELVVADVDAMGTPAIELVAPGGLDYLLAVPTAGGSTRFWDLVCPAVGACNAPIVRAGSDVQTRTTVTPSEVHLASLPGGAHALVTLEPSATDGARVDLRVLDDALTSIVELPEPLVVAESSTIDVVATEVRAVTDGSLVTVVVAALVRDSLRREDHIVLAGFRACTDR